MTTAVCPRAVSLRLLSLLVLLLACASGCKRHHHRAPSKDAAGAKLYKGICAVCHGRKGEGYAADRAPRLIGSGLLASASDDFMRRVIDDGRKGTTMTAWSRSKGGPLQRKEVDQIIGYLRSRDRTPKVALDEGPRTGDATRGGAIYEKECTRCHGAEGVEGPQVHIGDGDFLASTGDGFLREAIRHGRAETPMPAFEGTLDSAAIEDVVAFMRSLQPPAVARAAAAQPVPSVLPLGPVPLNPDGPEPEGFNFYPKPTKLDVVKAQLDRGARMAILDSRGPPGYADNHIAGAVSVPYYGPEPYFDQLPKDAWLVCYCACPSAESGMLANKLTSHGFTKVTVLEEGLNLWRSKKYPLHKGVLP